MSTKNIDKDKKNLLEFKEILVKTKNEIDSKFDEYINECNDIIDILRVYYIIRYRDVVSFGSNYNSFRPVLSKLYSQACRRIKINAEEVQDRLNEVHRQYNNTEEHYTKMTEAIDSIIKELKKDNSKDILIKKIEDSRDISIKDFCDGVATVHETLLEKFGYKTNDGKPHVELIDFYSTLTDFKIGKDIKYKKAYELADFPGERDSNVGAFVALTEDNNIAIVPIGTGFINKITNSYYESNVFYTDDFTKAMQKLYDIVSSRVKFIIDYKNN